LLAARKQPVCLVELLPGVCGKQGLRQESSQLARWCCCMACWMAAVCACALEHALLDASIQLALRLLSLRFCRPRATACWRCGRCRTAPTASGCRQAQRTQRSLPPCHTLPRPQHLLSPCYSALCMLQSAAIPLSHQHADLPASAPLQTTAPCRFPRCSSSLGS